MLSIFPKMPGDQNIAFLEHVDHALVARVDAATQLLSFRRIDHDVSARGAG